MHCKRGTVAQSTRRVVTVALVLLLPTSMSGCADGKDEGLTQAALQSVDDCMQTAGVGTNDVGSRYATEPAFARALDACAETAGVTANEVLGMLREYTRVNAEVVNRAAECMNDRGYPMEVETLPDGNANFGDLSRYFEPDTLDEFFDDFADCNEQPRDSFPTERQMESDREARAAQ